MIDDKFKEAEDKFFDFIEELNKEGIYLRDLFPKYEGNYTGGNQNE